MLQKPPTTDQPKRKRKLLSLLNMLLIVAVLAVAVVLSTTTVSAAHAASVPESASSPLSVTSSVLVTVSQNSAGNPCRTFTSYLSFGYLGVHNEIWLKLVTSFCYNNNIVTYHKTTESWGVTKAGSASGWGWQLTPRYSFNCFNGADNAYRPCSGNHEHAQEIFINPFLKNEASLTIDQSEYYNGKTYNNFNSHVCPGGC